MAKFVDNSAAVLRQFNKNKKAALLAIGAKYVEIASMEIRTQPRMRDKIPVGTGMIDTGGMIAANTHTQPQNDSMIVGNTAFSDKGAPYPLYVNTGTRKMSKRPWFDNAIQNYSQDYEEVAVQELRKGF